MPYVKGEGPSQMVADLVSADYGWLQSPNGKEEARVFKAGKNCEGYFTNQDILEQAQRSMDILEKHYTNENHVLMFDNATTPLKYGKLLKGNIQMGDATFADGSKQSLYFSEDAGPKASLFKGMAVILHEQGLI
ncbi:uncharacterized protein EDB93DRAFT_1100023 [Suillus bovinus]|uniref:uncharacterized protein n=1 Tax=Suillus bovinus TaxID=48563 RepID=UPI001B86D263|nr:uncharacterized protein EDB93DRAFT_1100023 [Suillus bovinus]KAG2158959.1 hypothetical protein EDB93DRAFT_1100023 [Suillus bovinus]